MKGLYSEQAKQARQKLGPVVGEIIAETDLELDTLKEALIREVSETIESCKAMGIR